LIVLFLSHIVDVRVVCHVLLREWRA